MTSQSERLKAAWRDGKFANRRKGLMWDAWMPLHDALLEQLAGVLTPAQIAERLTDRFPIPRTETAVVVRMRRLGISRVSVDLTARQMGNLFGVDAKTITHSWIARGWLTGDRIHDMPGGGWIFRPAHIDAFIRNHAHAYDWRQMAPGRWRDLATLIDRGDPWMRLNEAASAIGVNPTTLNRHCAMGLIQHARRFARYGAQNGLIVIRRSALRRFRYLRPELAGRSGRKKVAA